jgi:DNA repair ATPase RecN
VNDQLANLYRDSQRELFAENEQLKRENAELRQTIIEADSAYNLNGETSTWDDTSLLVTKCQQGAEALRQVTALVDAIYRAHAALCEANTSRGDLRSANAAAESILWYAIRTCQPSPS